MTSTLTSRQKLLKRAANRLLTILNEDGDMISKTLELLNDEQKDVKPQKPKVQEAIISVQSNMNAVLAALDHYRATADQLSAGTPAKQDVQKKIEEVVDEIVDLIDRASTYHTNLLQLKNKLERIGPQTANTNIAKQGTPPTNLPPIPIPKFSGKLEEWEAFCGDDHCVYPKNINDCTETFYKVTPVIKTQTVCDKTPLENQLPRSTTLIDAGTHQFEQKLSEEEHTNDAMPSVTYSISNAKQKARKRSTMRRRLGKTSWQEVLRKRPIRPAKDFRYKVMHRCIGNVEIRKLLKKETINTVFKGRKAKEPNNYRKQKWKAIRKAIMPFERHKINLLIPSELDQSTKDVEASDNCRPERTLNHEAKPYHRYDLRPRRN